MLADVEIDGLPADGSSFAWFDGDRYLAADPLSGDGTWQVQASVTPDAAGTVEPASVELFQRLFAERGLPQVRLRNATWLSTARRNSTSATATARCPASTSSSTRAGMPTTATGWPPNRSTWCDPTATSPSAASPRRRNPCLTTWPPC